MGEPKKWLFLNNTLIDPFLWFSADLCVLILHSCNNKIVMIKKSELFNLDNFKVDFVWLNRKL